MKKLVVILIIAHKEELSDNEIASLKQCYKILGKYPIKLISPKGLNVDSYKKIKPDIEFEFIDPKWQSDYRMFNKLKIAPLLYEKFENYKFVFYYELDAWVFRDELEYWCKKGYDYIGAPWIKELADGKPVFSPLGGNGGFSLRKVESHLKILRKWKIWNSPSDVWKYHRKFHDNFNMFMRLPVIVLRMLGYQNNSRHFSRVTHQNEDYFWCIESKKIIPHFIVAPPDECLKFSFEKLPSMLYAMNENKLPFGCHAWEKHESEFWKQFIPL